MSRLQNESATMIRLAIALLLCLFATAAQATHARHSHHGRHLVATHADHFVRHHRRIHIEMAMTHDGRPRAWCGWFGRYNFVAHDPGPDFNLAANWKRLGTAVATPQNGDIAIWDGHGHHHVGKIVGACSGFMCPVWSGNDSHTVRTRVRSVAGAVFRRLT